MAIKYICQEHGCRKEADVYRYDHLEWSHPQRYPVEWLCVEHAIEAGFCYMCGNFWAGVEAYDFSKVEGVCPNCIVEFEDPDYEDDYADANDYWGFMEFDPYDLD